MFRKLAKILVLAAIISIPFAGNALARNAILTNSDGAKVNIRCNQSVCFIRHTNAYGKRSSIQPAGPATTVNFVRVLKIWQAKGYR